MRRIGPSCAAEIQASAAGAQSPAGRNPGGGASRPKRGAGGGRDLRPAPVEGRKGDHPVLR